MITDQQIRLERDRVFPVAKKWKQVLGLNSWEITHHFEREEFDSDNKDAAAYTVANWTYLWAGVHWNVRQTIDYDDDTIELFVIHELVHILIDSMTQYARNREGHEGPIDMSLVERTTTDIAWAIRWAYQEGKGEGAEPDVYGQLAVSLR